MLGRVAVEGADPRVSMASMEKIISQEVFGYVALEARDATRQGGGDGEAYRPGGRSARSPLKGKDHPIRAAAIEKLIDQEALR